MSSNPTQVGDWNSTTHKYGSEHELQKLAVWNKPSEDSLKAPLTSKKIWVIYIHGGAWRDPTIKDTSFIPTLTQLTTSSSHASLVENHVEAFASIDYRLSAHPNFPQDITTTPASKYRDAKHPDHILDIHSAIRFLQNTYGFAGRYILVGHSCGATLALQSVMSASIPPLSNDFKGPLGIVSVAGIYDLRVLRDTNSHPEYARFIKGAFGNDESIWDAVSPARYGEFERTWKEGKIVVLASSKDDELIDDPQIDSMGKIGLAEVVKMKNQLTGAHDELWSEGVQLARAIGEILSRISG